MLLQVPPAGILYLAGTEPRSWKYRNLLFCCNANCLQISWQGTAFEFITAISEKRFEFLWMKRIIFVEWKRLRSEICILLKRDMLINESHESYDHISSFWSLREFTDKLPFFFWHLLDRKLSKMGRKSKQSLEVPVLTRELYISQGKICVSARVGKSFTKCLLSEVSVRSSSRKWYFQLYFTQVIHSNGKCSLLDENIVYQSFYGASLTFRRGA